MAGKRQFKKKRPLRTNKTKKLVTGQGPTLLERLAHQSNNIGLVAKSILPIAMAINTEHKYLDQALSGVAYSPGSFDSLQPLSTAIAQGLTDQTRIGNSVLSKDVNCKVSLNFNPTATTGPLVSMARVIFFIWKENIQDNPPTASKIFEAPTNFLSPFNKDYTDQMVILKDKIINQNAPLNVSVAQSQSEFKYFKKLDFHMRFDGSTTADSTVNHLWVIFRGSNPLVANAVNYTIYSRMNYTDN